MHLIKWPEIRPKIEMAGKTRRTEKSRFFSEQSILDAPDTLTHGVPVQLLQLILNQVSDLKKSNTGGDVTDFLCLQCHSFID